MALELGVDVQQAFVSGVQTLDDVVDVLCEGNSNELISAIEERAIVQQLSLPIHRAHEHFTKALQLCEGETGRISENIERRVQEISQLDASASQKQIKIDEMGEKLKSLGQQIDSNEAEVAEAKSSLNRANETLRERRNDLDKKERDQAIVAVVGAGISLIPVVGWIAGPTTIVVSLTAMRDAVKAAENSVNSARENVSSCENRLDDKKNSQRYLQEELNREHLQLQDVRRKLEALSDDKIRLQDEQRSLTVVQEKLRNMCHFFTKISGKSKVLKLETSENSYSLEPLFTPLKEIIEMIAFNEENKSKVTTSLLYKDMDFSRMSFKMKAICEKNEIDDLV